MTITIVWHDGSRRSVFRGLDRRQAEAVLIVAARNPSVDSVNVDRNGL